VGFAAAHGGVPVAGDQAGGGARAAAVGVPARRGRVRQRVHPADGAPRPGHPRVADDRRHPLPLHELLRGAVPGGRAPGDPHARRGVRLRGDQRSILFPSLPRTPFRSMEHELIFICSDKLGGVPAVDHRRGIHPRRARRGGDARRQPGRAQGDTGVIMPATRHRKPIPAGAAAHRVRPSSFLATALQLQSLWRKAQ
jgi:hypothetical protein